MIRNFFLLVTAPFLIACFSNLTSWSLYKKGFSGKFSNSNYQYLTKKYPFTLEIKGVIALDKKVEAIATIMSYLDGQSIFSGTNLVSELDNANSKVDEISLVIHLNSPSSEGAGNICNSDLKAPLTEKPLSTIRYVNIGYCRNNQTYSYISARFAKPTSIESDDFKNMLRRAAYSILHLPNETRNLRCADAIINC